MATAAAYIDGFNLYFGMKNKFGRQHLWLDVVQLVRHLRPNDQLVKVRYFTAIVKNEPAAAANQGTYLDALKAGNGSLLELHLGRFKDRRLSDCRRCQQPYRCMCPRTYKGFEEKETDVALGATMVADAALGIGDTTLLVSADTDLIPALKQVRRIDPSRKIYLAMPPGNTTPGRHLAAVPGCKHFHINGPALRQSQLPAAVADPQSGRTYPRPAKWS